MRSACLVVLFLVTTLSAQEASTRAPLTGRAVIDQEIRAKCEDLGVRPAALSDDGEFLRRATLDITGTIPPLELAERFLSDPSPDKREQLVDELLATEGYVESWAWYWASGLVNQFESDIVNTDVAIHAVAKELRELFRRNAPLDAVATAIITGTGRSGFHYNKRTRDFLTEWTRDKDSGLALWFLRVQLEAGREMPQALAARFSRAFLGVQISCAQCHDHPFDQWTQEDFYGMAGFFTDVAIKPLELGKGAGGLPYSFEIIDRGGRKPKTSNRGLAIPDAGGRKIPPAFLGTREQPGDAAPLREQFARMLTAKSNAQFARAAVNRLWAHFLGRGFVHPPDDFNGRNKPSHPQLLQALANDFAAHDYDLKWLIREICNSQTYQRTSRTRQRDAQAARAFAVAPVRPLRPEHVANAVLTASLTDPGTVNAIERTMIYRDFRTSFGEDQGTGLATYDGNVPSALMVMNSALVSRVTGGGGSIRAEMQSRLPGDPKPANRLDAILATKHSSDERVRAIFLTCLSRPPAQEELWRHVEHVVERGRAGYEDVMWALLNSSEFILNH